MQDTPPSIEREQREIDKLKKEIESNEEIPGNEFETKTTGVDMEKQQTPEELQQERLTAIIDDLKSKTDNLTEEGKNEIFFDYIGKGKNSIPARAKEILIDRFPEYDGLTEEARREKYKKDLQESILDRQRIRKYIRGAETSGGYEEQSLIEKAISQNILKQEDVDAIYASSGESELGVPLKTQEGETKGPEEEKLNQSEAENSIDFVEYKENTESLPDYESNELSIESAGNQELMTKTKEVLGHFEKVGIHGEVDEVEGNDAFKEMIIFPKNPSEGKMVRLYRGNQELGESTVNQISPAMRFEGEGNEEIGDIVKSLSDNPSYENLMIYRSAIDSSLSDFERSQMDSEIKSIEDSVLDGDSDFKKALIYNHIAYPGGNPANGISPYLSASKNISEAIGFGKNILVIDIPASEIESFGENSSEVNIKGLLSPEYISAILPSTIDKKAVSQEDLDDILRKVDEKIHVGHEEVPVISEEEIKEEVLRAHENLIAIQEKRSEDLLKEFSDLQISRNKIKDFANEKQLDVYSATKMLIFDTLNERNNKVSKFPIEEFDFYENGSYGKSIKYDRDNISDQMLRSFNTRLLHVEERTRERMEER